MLSIPQALKGNSFSFYEIWRQNHSNALGVLNETSWAAGGEMIYTKLAVRVYSVLLYSTFVFETWD
jgi:hypothetical protein